MSASSSTKETSIDRLSALPDSLLTHILAFLEVKVASITSLLSKRWQFLWTQLPRLVFRKGYNETEPKFIARIYRTLVIYSRNNLEILQVQFRWYKEEFAYDVNSWVEFAVRNKVKEFHLLLDGSKIDYDRIHTLPQIMYSNSSFTSLYLQRCVMAPRKEIEWHCLTELRINETLLSQFVVEKILSGCPVLRGLYLVDCWGFNYLEIKSPSLCELCVSAHRLFDNELPLGISAPYVRYLEMNHPGERKLYLRNVQSLVRADIELTVSKWDPISEEVISNAKELLVKTLHVKRLQLGSIDSIFFEVMSELVFNGWQLPQSTRECLRVCVCTGDNYMHITSGFLALLESSPMIDTLSIDLDVADIYEDLVNSGPSTRDDLDCDLQHLKTVRIKFRPGGTDIKDQMLTWVRILLKRATVLEEMVIKTDYRNARKFFKIRKTLLSYPRSSENAVVVVRERFYKF